MPGGIMPPRIKPFWPILVTRFIIRDISWNCFIRRLTSCTVVPEPLADAAAAAETLAELKANKISMRAPGALVIGADQILECEGRWFDKPPDRTAAVAHLRALGGKTHALATAVCVVRDGVRIWHHREAPRLTMRPLDGVFIESYLDAAGPEVLETVGAYRLEDLGAQLFTKVSGDYFTILGLPLLPLLGFLREHGVPAS